MSFRLIFQYFSAFILKRIESRDASPSFPGRQQLITFVLYTLAMVLGLTANLCGLTGPQNRFTFVLNSVFLAVVILLAMLFLIGRLSLARTFCLVMVVAQLFTCSEMLFCALYPSAYRLMLIVGNIVLLSVNVMFSLIAYLKNVPYLLGALAMATYIACVVITENDALESFCLVFLLMFLAITVLGNMLVRNMKRLSRENTELRQEEEDILHALKLEKQQVLAYVKLAKQRHDVSYTQNILEQLADESRDNVIRNVKEAINEEEMKKSRMAEIFPELTPSEIEICRLVILEKTLNEVCEILGKTEGNITCQRSNIRRKLGLKPADNLKKVLQARFNLHNA